MACERSGLVCLLVVFIGASCTSRPCARSVLPIGSDVLQVGDNSCLLPSESSCESCVSVVYGRTVPGPEGVCRLADDGVFNILIGGVNEARCFVANSGGRFWYECAAGDVLTSGDASCSDRSSSDDRYARAVDDTGVRFSLGEMYVSIACER